LPTAPTGPTAGKSFLGSAEDRNRILRRGSRAWPDTWQTAPAENNLDEATMGGPGKSIDLTLRGTDRARSFMRTAWDCPVVMPE
jgi:hypothetical protein